MFSKGLPLLEIVVTLVHKYQPSVFFKWFLLWDLDPIYDNTGSLCQCSLLIWFVLGYDTIGVPPHIFCRDFLLLYHRCHTGWHILTPRDILPLRIKFCKSFPLRATYSAWSNKISCLRCSFFQQKRKVWNIAGDVRGRIWLFSTLHDPFYTFILCWKILTPTTPTMQTYPPPNTFYLFFVLVLPLVNFDYKIIKIFHIFRIKQLKLLIKIWFHHYTYFEYKYSQWTFGLNKCFD